MGFVFYLSLLYLYSCCGDLVFFSNCFQLARIHATVKKALVHQFQPILHEGSTYLIDKLLVAANDLKFPSTSHKYKLNFMGITNCIVVEASQIPTNHFKFMPFPEIAMSPKDEILTGIFTLVYLF